jgi:hypothetical protein
MGPIVNHPPAGIVNINEARNVVSVRGFQARRPRRRRWEAAGHADSPPVPGNALHRSCSTGRAKYADDAQSLGYVA